MTTDEDSDTQTGEFAPLVAVLIEHAWNTYTGRCDCGWYVPSGLNGHAIDVAHASHQAQAVVKVLSEVEG